MNPRAWLLGGVLLSVLTACPLPYPSEDINFLTDPRVLRGAYAGTLDYDCTRASSIAAYSADGSRLLTRDNDALVVWDAGARTRLRSVVPQNSVNQVVWDGAGTVFTTISFDQRTVQRFDAATGNPVTGRFTLPSGAGTIVAVSPDGRTLIAQPDAGSWNTDGILQAWNIGAFDQPLWTKSVGQVDLGNGQRAPLGVNTLNFNTDGSSFAFYGAKGVVVARTSTGATSVTVSVNPFTTGGIGWQGSNLVVLEAGVQAIIVDAQSGVRRTTYALGTNLSNPLFSRDGKRLLMYVYDAFTPTLRVWNLETGARVGDFALETWHLSYSGGYAFTPDNLGLLLEGTPQTCALDVLNISTGVKEAAFVLDTPQRAPVTFTFQPTLESPSSYTLTGTVGGKLLEGYTLTGRGYGGDCYAKAVNGPVTCDRWVKPQMSLPPAGFARASLKLTKSGAPDYTLEIAPVFPNREPPNGERWGALSIAEQRFLVNIKAVSP